jgi:hypothetical protein
VDHVELVDGGTEWLQQWRLPLRFEKSADLLQHRMSVTNHHLNDAWHVAGAVQRDSLSWY